MPQEYIEIRGARENNLKNVSLRIPKRKITIFTGVSGSGKSSIVFDTVATEAQRQMNENFSMFIRTFLPRYSQPNADAIENLSMPIVVDQKRLGGGSHSTTGTITDIYPVPPRLYSHIGKPHVGHANVFSFNDPKGMCPNCNGLGRKMGVDLDLFLDKSKTLNEGAILFPEYAVDSCGLELSRPVETLRHGQKAFEVQRKGKCPLILLSIAPSAVESSGQSRTVVLKQCV
jgi:excinuclease UvrABC ATPase subunit